MKTTLVRDIERDARSNYPDTSGPIMETTYPQLYCPRCGSYEIGLRRFQGDQAIWGCRDCTAEFTLNFPDHSRF